MPDNKKIFEVFPPVSLEQWVQQAVKDLKGESFNEKLKYNSSDGISISPFYALEDLTKYNERISLFTHSDWEVCDEIVVVTEKQANEKALKALNSGATSIIFHIEPEVDLAILLKEIQIEYIAIQFVLKKETKQFKDNLNVYLNAQKINPAILNLNIHFDPFSDLLKTGEWSEPIEASKNNLASLFSPSNSYRMLNVNASVYHNGGASQGYEIGCALAHLNEYLKWMMDCKIEPTTLENKIQLNVAVGPDYFFEIAKLRAYRKAFALLFEEYKINTEVYIHAETAFRNLTVFDAHNNLLRATTQSMAAVIGGCNSLYVLPYDSIYASGNYVSSRLSRNIQLILKSECYFDKVADISAGSYFIEELTEQLAEKAWLYFVDIEKRGGFSSCIEKGIIQTKIKSFAKMEQHKFDEAKTILVGTNKFQDLKENKMGIRNDVVVGNENANGKTIEPLDLSRLSAQNEKSRFQVN